MSMITLAEVVQLVDQLTPDEKHALREHLDTTGNQRIDATSEQRIDALNRAIDAMREGLSEQQLDELEWAMNYEFIAKADEE